MIYGTVGAQMSAASEARDWNLSSTVDSQITQVGNQESLWLSSISATPAIRWIDSESPRSASISR